MMSPVLLSARLFHLSAAGRPISGNIGQPCWRRRYANGRCRRGQIEQKTGVAHDRADGHRKRKQHEEQQNQRHQRRRRPATSAERGLQPQHERPRGNHQCGRPNCCREKRLQNEKGDGYQAENRQDGKRRACQVERFRRHRALQRWKVLAPPSNRIRSVKALRRFRTVSVAYGVMSAFSQSLSGLKTLIAAASWAVSGPRSCS